MKPRRPPGATPTTFLDGTASGPSEGVSACEKCNDVSGEWLRADDYLEDRLAAQQRLEFAVIRSEIGRWLDPGELTPAGELRGTGRLICQYGDSDGEVWLALTPEPRLQTLTLQPQPKSGELRRD